MVMTLNDNPRTKAEKRLQLLNKQRDWWINYKSSRLQVEYENGVAARVFINPYVKADRASKLIAILNKEIQKTEKYLKRFK